MTPNRWEERDDPARVCFFVNKRFDHKKWHFKQHTKDICTLKICLEEKGQMGGQLDIHNVYNPVQGTEDRRCALPLLREVLGSHESEE